MCAAAVGGHHGRVTPPRLRVAAALVVSVAAAALLAGCAFIDSANEHEERSYTVDEKVDALSVRDPSGRIEVLTGTGPVSVREQYTYASSPPKTSHKVESGTLNLVNSGCDQSGLNRRCQVDYRIEVPAGTAVTVDADAGQVTITGITAAVKINADAGAVQLTAVTGAVEVTANAGTIKGTGLAGVTKVHSDAGSVDLAYVKAPTSVDASSDAGRVTVRLPAGTYAVDAKVSAGHRTVDVANDPNSPNRITVRSDAGSVEVIPA
jgi:hypothetical protein